VRGSDGRLMGDGTAIGSQRAQELGRHAKRFAPPSREGARRSSNVGYEPLLLDQAWRRLRERARGASGSCVCVCVCVCVCDALPCSTLRSRLLRFHVCLRFGALGALPSPACALAYTWARAIAY
jgi:hypothetical protein